MATAEGRKLLQRLGLGALATGLFWAFTRFLLPWLAPFLLAYALAALLEGAVRVLCSRGVPRAAAALLLTLTVLLALSALLMLLCERLMLAVGELVKIMPQLAQALSRVLTAAGAAVEHIGKGLPHEYASLLESLAENAAGSLYGLPAALSQALLDRAALTAKGAPGAALFAITAGLGSYFLSASFPRVSAFLFAQLPRSARQRTEELREEMHGCLRGWLRAQLLLAMLTFFQLLVLFLLLGQRGAVWLAALVAFIDALPVLGTGAVLVPWALGCLLLGAGRKGLGLLLGWAVCSTVRSCAQPKLLGDRIGLDPIGSLLALYVGWCVWGVWGMLLCPLLAVVLRLLNERGIVHLWEKA